MNYDDILNKELYICENGMEFFVMCEKNLFVVCVNIIKCKRGFNK